MKDSDLNKYAHILKRLESKFKLFQLLEDLSIKSADISRIRSWRDMMSYIADEITSKAW